MPLMLSKFPKEPAPWGFRKPRADALRLGVLYQQMTLSDVDMLLFDEAHPSHRATIRTLMGAIGPKLWWDRLDGPWIPFDGKIVDQNEECKIKDRPWPWCFGDEVWMRCSWLSTHVFVHYMTPSACEMLLVRPDQYTDAEMLSALTAWAHETTAEVSTHTAYSIAQRQ